MIKGDQRKQDILRTAEEMFCKNGYEQTSVQDIINSMNSSKGSFYHHFASKETVLEAICRNRAQQIYKYAADESGKTGSVISRLNIMLSGMIPLHEKKLRFLLMLLPVFTLPEGRTIRQSFCDALTYFFYTPVCQLIREGRDSGYLYCTDPENSAIIILSVINLLWVRICDILINNENRNEEPDLPECLRLTECCREAVEKMLSLQYGSVGLIDIPILKLTADSIHIHWPK